MEVDGTVDAAASTEDEVEAESTCIESTSTAVASFVTLAALTSTGGKGATAGFTGNFSMTFLRNSCVALASRSNAIWYARRVL